MVAVIKGAGDIASGIATRLKRAGFDIVMTDIERPTSIRNTVSFSQAIIYGEFCVEGIKAVCAKNTGEIQDILVRGDIAVIADENARCIKTLKPDVIIDAILAKKNTGTTRNDAATVIGVGPGFTAKIDCDAVVETKRGHDLGRVIYSGKASENTGIPGNIAGFTEERIIRAPRDGAFIPKKKIGDNAKKGEIIAYVGNEPVFATIDGVIRGLLPEGIKVYKGMKSGDIDPRGIKDYCYTCSDKALAVAGGVLEAILNLSEKRIE